MMVKKLLLKVQHLMATTRIKWKAVVGYEGYYEVSDTGFVRSLDRYETIYNRHEKPFIRRRKGKVLKLSLGNAGYLTVSLCQSSSGKRKYVHRVVAETFLKCPKHLFEVNHLDGDKTNNNLFNLEWTDRRGNSIHSTRVLRKNIGSKVGTSKLSEEQVLEIKDMLERGSSQSHIGRFFNVSNHAIHRIKHGDNWAWLTGYGKEGTRHVA